MAGWLPLAMSKGCGCNLKLLQDGWGMIGWLAPTRSTDSGCNCRPPIDGWEVAGWLALAISNYFGCDFGSLGDGWEMVGRTPVVLEPPTQKQTSVQYTQKHTIQMKTRTRWLGGRLWLSHNKVGCESKSPGDGQVMVGRWLCGWPLLFPKIAGVIADLCEMAGR